MSIEAGPIRVLLIDDSPAILWGLGKLIQGEFPHMSLTGTARSYAESLAYMHLRPDVIVLDLELEHCSSIEIIPTLQQRSGARVLMHTGLGDPRLHADAMLFGAAGVVDKGASGATLLEAIECVFAGKFWNLAPSASKTAFTCDIPQRCALSALSPAERSLIAKLSEALQTGTHLAFPAPVAISQLLSLYDKLGLRNRQELRRFAEDHGLLSDER